MKSKARTAESCKNGKNKLPAEDGYAGFAPVGCVGGDAEFGDDDKKEDEKQNAEGDQRGKINGFAFGKFLRVESIFGEE